MFVLFSAGRDQIQSLCFLAGALLFLTLTGCVQNPVTGQNDFVMLSENAEIGIGRSNHPKIIAQYGRYDNEALQAYVQSVGEHLAAVSHRPNLVYRFTVLDSPIINAFALPGGYIYITRGLMAYLNSEAELAAVLGHEIGHVTARHGVRQQSAAQAASLGYTLGAIFFPELRAAPSQDLFNLFGGALLSGYGREHELEADGLGAEYITKAGYDTEAMMEVIRVLKAQELFATEQAKKQGRKVQSYHGLFATHPDNDTRLQNVVAAADKFSLGKKGIRYKAKYLQHINGLVFGDSEKQGIRSNNHFYHLIMDFAVDFPIGWQIRNNPDSLQAVSVGGKAFIEMRAVDINRKVSPQTFIKQRLNLGLLNTGQQITVNGLKGYTGIVTLQGGKPARISVIYLRDKAFVFFASVKDNTIFTRFDTDFIRTAKSLHSLSKSEKRLARSKRIEVVTVTSGDNYPAWAAKSRITNSPLLQLKLLNGDYPSGELTIGELAKRIK